MTRAAAIKEGEWMRVDENDGEDAEQSRAEAGQRMGNEHFSNPAH